MRTSVSRGDGEAQAFRTAAVERGEIRMAISATGTLSATATVDVGTQVSGILQAVDVDFNDNVKKDQVIARIDPSTFQARLDQAAASLDSARASLNEAQAQLRNAESDYARKADLVKRQLVARSDVDLPRWRNATRRVRASCRRKRRSSSRSPTSTTRAGPRQAR